MLLFLQAEMLVPGKSKAFSINTFTFALSNCFDILGKYIFDISTILSSISLHGIRLSESTIGEKYLVVGLGLLGLLTCELLLASGCEVIGVDENQLIVKRKKEIQ